MIICPELSKISGLKHGFFTRNGGVSEGIYASLNCGHGSADKIENVTENRRRVMQELGSGVKLICNLYQIHSDKVVNVTEPWHHINNPQADAMATNKKGIGLGILTADCAPVLFADSEARVIAAAHAGWKGAKAGIVDNTVREMERLGANRKRIIVTIGPCIGHDSYEVGPEFREEFINESRDNGKFFAPARQGKFSFDLVGYLTARLNLLGVTKVGHTGHDTFSDEKNFFSYRRNTTKGIKDYGRQISVICMV